MGYAIYDLYELFKIILRRNDKMKRIITALLMLLIFSLLTAQQQKAIIVIKSELAGILLLDGEQKDVLWKNDEKKIEITRPGIYQVEMQYTDGKKETATITVDSLKTYEVKFTKAIEIGTRGPAGGFIFYDKGNYDNGWRYLEAAPYDVPGKYPWGPDGIRGLGNGGKDDTDTIIRQAGQHGVYAALVAKNFQYNGYTDWFLPDGKELTLMYSNLYRKGLGNFKSAIYWGTCEPENNYATGKSYNFGTEKNTFAGSHYVRPIRRF